MTTFLQARDSSIELNVNNENKKNSIKLHLAKSDNYGKPRKVDEVSSLQDLISKIYEEFDKDVVDVDYINNLMTSYKSVPQEWKKYAKFDRYRDRYGVIKQKWYFIELKVEAEKGKGFQVSASVGYTRNLVDAGNGKFNLMVLCWGEGHGSAIHDHADAHCFMKVLDGTLSEVRFAFPEESQSETSNYYNGKMKEIGRTDLKTNEVCYINDSLGLHRVENPSHVNAAVSLHLYSPPFDQCSVFNQQTGQRTKIKVTFWSRFGEHKHADEERIPEDN